MYSLHALEKKWFNVVVLFNSLFPYTIYYLLSQMEAMTTYLNFEMHAQSGLNLSNKS